MINYPIDLYERAKAHQQQLRKEAQQDYLARQAATDAGEAERAESAPARGGSMLKAKGKARPAPAGRRPAITCSDGHLCPQPNKTTRPH